MMKRERERKRRLSCWMEQSSSSNGECGAIAEDTDRGGTRSWSWEEDPLYRRYQQLDLIGIGKYSEVYAGKDVVTGQDVALKIIDRRRLLSEDGPKDEYKKLSGLCHRNIVSGLALFTESPKEYFDTIVMTRVKGSQILEHICSVQGKEAKIKKLFLQVIYALQYLLSQHVVHGDIKPENVLVESDGTVRLVDFGPSEPDQEFAAPEALTAVITHSSDMWSLGVLLYVTLSGVSPFLDDCPEETFNNICTANYSFPPDYFSGVPEDALFLVTSALAPDPDQRALPNSLLLSPWFKENDSDWTAPVERLLNFIERRKKSACCGL